jgi:hypothetical protein
MHPTNTFARRPYLPREIVARVEKGELLKVVCADVAISLRTVARMRRDDPAFHAALSEAQSRGKMLRWRRYDEAKAAEILRRLQAGATLRSIYRDPSLPDERTLTTWRRSQIYFGETIYWHIHRQQRLIQAQNHNRRRDFDPVLAERILLLLAKGQELKRLREVDPSIPAHDVLWRWRREQPDFDSDVRVIVRHGPKLRRARRARAVAPMVAEALRNGGSLNSIAEMPGMPRASTLSRWARRGGEVHPLGDAIRQACDDRDDLLADEIVDIAEGPGEPADKRRRMRLVYAQMRRGRSGGARLPKGIPAFMRRYGVEADEPEPGGENAVDR